MREFFLLCALRAASQGVGAAQQSEIRTGPCTILSVFEVIWEIVEIEGRKEMGILRRAELEGLHSRLRSRLPKCLRGRRKEILAPQWHGTRSVPDLLEEA